MLRILSSCGRWTALSLLLALVLPGKSAEFPEQPIELIVPWAAGGASDATARAFADAAKGHLSQPIIVSNRPGATGSVGWSEVARGKPDGYKLALLTAEILIIPHIGIGKISNDDFVPIVRFNSLASAVSVRADAPWKSVEEFLAQAKREPESIKVGNSGVGSIWHLAAAELSDKAGVRFTHIPYPGGNPAVLALLGGHIDAATVSTAEVHSNVASGKLRVLAVMAESRLPGFDVPTLKERGLDVVVGSWTGLGAPRNTPPKTIDVLRNAARQAVAEPAFVRTMDTLKLNAGLVDSVDFGQQMARDSKSFKQIVDKLQIKVN